MKEPNTDCPECWWIEANWWQKIKSVTKVAIPEDQTVQQIRSISWGYAMMLNAALGKPVPKRKSWYDRHRDLFTESGDAREYERMLRHVR